MFGNIESYFPSDNIHLFVPFERLQLRIFQSIYFNSNNKNWLFLHLLLPTNLSRLVRISAKVGLQLVGVRLLQPGHRVHQAPSFPLPLPCSPIPTCLQHAPRPRERSRKTKKTPPTSLVFSRHLSSLTLRGSTSQERSPSWHHCSRGSWLLARISKMKKLVWTLCKLE